MTLSRRNFLQRVALGSGAAVLQLCCVTALPRFSAIAHAERAAETVEVAPSPRLEAQLFGPFVLRRDGRTLWEPSWRMSRAQSMAALLILNPRGLPSEWLGRLIIPEIGESQPAVHTVQMAAFMLRKQLGSKAAVRFKSATYRLNPRLPLTADVREFDRALTAARNATGAALLENLSKAVGLYQAPLLTNLHDPWVEPIRANYESRYARARAQLAKLQAARS